MVIVSRDPIGHVVVVVVVGQTGGQGATLPQQRGSLAWRRPFEGSAWNTPPLAGYLYLVPLLLPPFLLPLPLLTTAHPHLLSLFAPGQLAGEELVVS